MCPVFCKHSVQTQRFDTRGIAHLRKQRAPGAWRDAPYAYGPLSTGRQGLTSIHVYARTGVEAQLASEKM